jgi:hypothetical protein
MYYNDGFKSEGLFLTEEDILVVLGFHEVENIAIQFSLSSWVIVCH